MNLLSWLDIERVIARHTQNFTSLPEGIHSIRTFSDAVEIGIANSQETKARGFLKTVFGNTWNDETCTLQLAYGNNVTVEVVITEASESLPHPVKPLWQDLGYVTTDDSVCLPSTPATFSSKTKMAAFHSFKGGVGRTTALLTWLAALKKAFHDPVYKAKRKKLKILLVDADLEAPGLTYLMDSADRPPVSWVQLLEAGHYPPVENQQVIQYFAQQIDRFSQESAGVEIGLLPAFVESEHLDMSQLMAISVRPEHLARVTDQPWHCTDLLHQLGTALDADLVLIDLRAGLSELASPLLFDPRIDRFVVTTLSEQAIDGTEFELKRLAALADNAEWRQRFGKETLDPRVITTFITETFKKTERYRLGINRLLTAYNPNNEQNDLSPTESVDIIEAGFSTELLHLGRWHEALKAVETANPLFHEAMKWAKSFLMADADFEKDKVPAKAPNDEVKQLFKTCDDLVYAEKGGSEALLLTEPLRNLAKRHETSSPQVIFIGAKGAGKTFNYIQLCRRQTWQKFLKVLNGSDDYARSSAANTYILPHLNSNTIRDKTLEAVNKARETYYQHVGVNEKDHFSHSHFTSDKLPVALKDDKIQWLKFWEKAIIELHGCDSNNTADFDALNQWLAEKSARTIVVIDGLEDYFPKVNENNGTNAQAQAIDALIHQLPNRLSEIRDGRIGVIVFIREDYVNAVTPQNLGQFIDRYKPYQLTWDRDAFLRLVYWICKEAGLSLADDPIDKLTIEDISQKLQQLWGIKLGKPNSREAYTLRWVYAALCDLRGRLQARDIVRFLKYASKQAQEQKYQKTLWQARVLPPQALRDAMSECSEEKVEEARQEFAILGDWIEQLNKVDTQYKQIPFAAKEVGLSDEQLERLIAFGIVYKDTQLSDAKRYYLPETYRQGLGFKMSRGGRPKIQSMLKDSLGKLPVDL